MSSSKYVFILDLHCKYSQIVLPVTAGDTDRELCISFSDGGRPYLLKEGFVATIALEFPTKATRSDVCTVAEDGTYVKYEFNEDTCPIAGLYEVQIVIYGNGKQIAAPRFTLDASGRISTDDNVEIPEGDVVVLDSIYQEEAKRQTAESERKTAEAERKSAEKKRETDTEAAIEDIKEIKKSIETMRDNGDFKGADGISPTIEAVATETGYKVTVNDARGPQEVSLYNGKDGAPGTPGISVFHSWEGTTLTIHSASGSSFADLKGEKGDKGERGEGIDIVKSFSSVAEMFTGAATDGVPIGKFVIIASNNVDDPDNSKLYVKTESGYLYLSDLSGAQGIRGEPGPQGEPGLQGVGISCIEKIDTNELVDTYKIIFTNGAETTFTITNGEKGSKGDKPEKGVDYFTDDDKAEMVLAVINALPNGDEVSY